MPTDNVFFPRLNPRRNELHPTRNDLRPARNPNVCANVESAVCVTVEERPFQGRVTNEVKMGFSPRGPLGVLHGG